MGVEGAPEGPEDPIAQICVTLGTVRVFRFSKHTRDTRQKRMLFFFPFIVLEVFPSIVVVQITQPPRRRSLGDSSCTLLLVYSLYLSLPFRVCFVEDTTLCEYFWLFSLSLWCYATTNTQVCAMGTSIVAMKDVFKAAKWHDCYKCGGCKEMKCKQCKGFGKVVGQFPEDEFDDEGRFLGASYHLVCFFISLYSIFAFCLSALFTHIVKNPIVFSSSKHTNRLG